MNLEKKFPPKNPKKSRALDKIPKTQYNNSVEDQKQFSFKYMTYYKPYTDAWHRKRYLKEALDNYLNEYVDNDVIFNDIISILSERSEKAYAEFSRINDLEYKLSDKTTNAK